MEWPGTSDAPFRADLAELASGVAAALPPLDALERRVGLAVYELIGTGRSAGPDALAAACGLERSEVEAVVARLPTAVTEGGAVTGFLGLQVGPTAHAIAFPEATGGTWCAWDGLFLPELLGWPARLRSTCPVTGAAIAVELDPDAGVVDVSPASARLSLLSRPQPFGGDIVAQFCRFVYLLADETAAAAFVERAGREDGVALASLTPDDGFAVGRLTNAVVFGNREARGTAGRWQG